MNVQIVKIHGKGKQDAEYVELKVLESCNLGYFMLTDTTYTSPDSISNKVRHVYWFPTHDVKKGDKIYLLTAVGTDTKTANSDGTTTYTKHWNLKVPVWNNEGDAAILFSLNTWKTTKA